MFRSQNVDHHLGLWLGGHTRAGNARPSAAGSRRPLLARHLQWLRMEWLSKKSPALVRCRAATEESKPCNRTRQRNH